MEKIFAPPLADSPNIERDRRRSVSEMWTSLLCNIETDAAASVAGLEERYFCKHRYFGLPHRLMIFLVLTTTSERHHLPDDDDQID